MHRWSLKHIQEYNVSGWSSFDSLPCLAVRGAAELPTPGLPRNPLICAPLEAFFLHAALRLGPSLVHRDTSVYRSDLTVRPPVHRAVVYWRVEDRTGVRFYPLSHCSVASEQIQCGCVSDHAAAEHVVKA